jgi:hypothetical protein
MLDASGTPVPTDDALAWGEWFEAQDTERQVALTKVSPDIRVSTTFLGIDHGFGLSTEAVLWETLIFGGAYDLAGERYTSSTDARAGHELWVMVARGELTPDVIREMRQITETT